MTHDIVPKYVFGGWNQVLGPNEVPNIWFFLTTFSVVAGRSPEQIKEAHRADPVIGSPIEGTAQRRPGWLGINE